MRKILAWILAALMLCGCSAEKPEAVSPETTADAPTERFTSPPETSYPYTEPPETSEPEPAWETVYTPESTALSVISYCAEIRELRVQFRESGAWYAYYDVEPEVWEAFVGASSKGRFLNASIKGKYDYKRLN